MIGIYEYVLIVLGLALAFGFGYLLGRYVYPKKQSKKD